MDDLENRMYEAFGLEAPTEETSAGSETDTSAEDTAEANEDATESGTAEETAEGENAQETAEPASDKQEAQSEEQQTKPGEQSPEERRENAARRRNAEKQAAIDAAVKAEQEKNAAAMKSFFERARLKNTVSGKPITNMEEFDAWQRDYNDARISRELGSGKVSKETFDAAVDAAVARNPAVLAALKAAEEAEKAREAAAKEAAERRIADQLAEIRKLDPQITSVQDILAGEHGKEFYDYVQRGNSFLDAYRLANFERLTAQAAERSREQAMSASRSKEHLRPTVQRGAGGPAAVSGEDLKMFRAFNPGASDKEIQEWAKAHAR